MVEKSPTTERHERLERTTHTASVPDRSKLFEVAIAGVPLRLKSSHDEQTVNELVALVDSKVREALPLTKTGSIQNAAILAALHLAEEYLMLKRKAQRELESLENKALKVLSELENSQESRAVGATSASEFDHESNSEPQTHS